MFGMISRRIFLSATAALTGAPVVQAQDMTAVQVAINEGVTYKLAAPATDRFSDVAADLQKLLKRPVQIRRVDSYKDLALGLKEKRYDLAWVHPAHHAILAQLQSGYRLLALTRGFTEYRAAFLINANSTLETLADLKGKRVGAPDEDSITAVMARAALRDVMDKLPQMTYVRYQDAVPFMVENTLVHSGVSASAAVVRAWLEKGGRVLNRTRAVPIKQWICADRMVPQAAELSAYLLGLDPANPDGARRLTALNVGGFIAGDQALMTELGKWLRLV